MTLKQMLGLDTRADRYAYGVDPVAGYVSNQKIPERWVSTTCGYCSVGCGMFIGVKGGRAVSVRGNPDHPVNRGMLCPKGLSEHHTIGAANRAQFPLLRQNGQMSPVSWDAAMTTMAARFRDVQARYGPGAVGVISTGQLVTEEFYALGKLVQLGIGTPNYDGNTTLCMATAVAGYKRSFGSDGPPGTYDDLEKADVVMLIGANIAENHPILCWRLRSNPGTTIIVVDPRVTKTAMLADLHLPLAPRSDLALLNGLIHVVIEHDLVDRDYVARHTSGFEALRESVREYTPERVAEITGLTPEVICRTAWTYAKANAGFIGWTMGVNHSTKGTETVNAINNLALITGQIGRAGAAPFSITGQCNAMGTREAGFASSLPGYRKFENATDREDLARMWNVPAERIPTQRGLAYPDIIEAVLERKIRALWIIATNPIVSFPNLHALQQALESLEFLVVQDGYHPTPTSEYAHLMLPAAMWGEKEGTYTNSERRVSKVNRAVAPPGDAKSDFDIFMHLADALGVRDEIFPGWKKPVDAFEEWKRVSAGRLCDYSGMTYQSLEQHGGLQWPFPTGAANPRATRRLYADGRFQTEDGRARLIPAAWEPFPEQPNEEFPFVLNTGRTVEHWHTRTKTANVPILERLSPVAWVEMNPRDARRLRLKPQDKVDVVSRRGSVRGVELRVTETVAPGQLFVPFHYAENNANEATQSAFDPISREPNYKQSAVRVEAASRERALEASGSRSKPRAAGMRVALAERLSSLGRRGARPEVPAGEGRLASADSRATASESRGLDPESQIAVLEPRLPDPQSRALSPEPLIQSPHSRVPAPVTGGAR
jgi:anaerobic selenocysteine-containing dehydrogenase